MSIGKTDAQGKAMFKAGQQDAVERIWAAMNDSVIWEDDFVEALRARAEPVPVLGERPSLDAQVIGGMMRAARREAAERRRVMSEDYREGFRAGEKYGRAREQRAAQREAAEKTREAWSRLEEIRAKLTNDAHDAVPCGPSLGDGEARYLLALVDEKDTQIERLANFIMAEVPGEPSRSEGAVDTAIRWMREQVRAIHSVKTAKVEGKEECGG